MAAGSKTFSTTFKLTSKFDAKGFQQADRAITKTSNLVQRTSVRMSSEWRCSVGRLGSRCPLLWYCLEIKRLPAAYIRVRIGDYAS